MYIGAVLIFDRYNALQSIYMVSMGIYERSLVVISL